MPHTGRSIVTYASLNSCTYLCQAYKNSLFSERYFKSRAVLFARAYSISAAAATTLAAVAPLLFARLLPLRDFGYVFAIVTGVSLLFAVVSMHYAPSLTAACFSEKGGVGGMLGEERNLVSR